MTTDGWFLSRVTNSPITSRCFSSVSRTMFWFWRPTAGASPMTTMPSWSQSCSVSGLYG